MPPLVSIITPCHNAAGYVGECIDSVRAQSMQDWEHIITDDGSSDNSVAIIERYAAMDDRIRLTRHEVNKGVAAARNTAIDVASGRYIAFLDADDLWHPDKLSIQLARMQENGWGFTYTDYAVIDTSGSVIRERIGVPPGMDYYRLLKNTAIGCLTVMLDTDAVGRVRMPDHPSSGQDTALWLKILRDGGYAHGIDEVLARYRIVPGSISRNKIRAARRMWKIYRESEDINVFLSAWYFLNYACNACRKNI